MKTLHISARRWNDTYGNTYHTTRLDFDGVTHIIPFAYGYGDHYLQTAAKWLEGKGLIRLKHDNPNHPPEPLWQWAQRTGCTFSYEAVDVSRKKDLHLGGKTG